MTFPRSSRYPQVYLASNQKDALILGLGDRLEALETRVQQLTADNAALRSENQVLRTENQSLRTENQVLRQDHEDLRRRLGLTPQNSHLPPTAAGLRKGPAEPRVKGRRSPGGQPGHRGATLKRVADPDRIEIRRPEGLCECGQALAEPAGQVVATRQVIELPLRREVTEYRVVQVRCDCGRVHVGDFPATVPMGLTYGPALRAFAVGLIQGHHVSVDRTAQILGDLVGFSPATGTLQTWIEEAATALMPTYTDYAATLRQAPVAHFDESGVRIEGQTQWLHVATDPETTYYTVHAKRGQAGMDAAGILPTFTGVAVHDHWASYYRYADCQHALCNAHILRELRFFEDFGAHPWATALRETLVAGLKATQAARTAGQLAVDPAQGEALLTAYRHQVAAGLAACPAQPPPEPGAPKPRGRLKQSKEYNLLKRLRDFEADIWRFLGDFAVPFTNNAAERKIRPVKVKLKVAGGFRSWAGAQAFCVIRSVWETCRLRQENPFIQLQAAFQG
jgi:transposase